MTIPLQKDIDWLEHHGVKGQQWGVRRAQKKQAKARNKALNKASRSKDFKEFEGTVDAARARRKGGAIKQERKAAKAQFHQDKAKVGSREARKILYEKRNKLSEEVAVSHQAKNGKEVAGTILAGAAIGVAYSLLLKSARA